jgi:hypothetical protein
MVVAAVGGAGQMRRPCLTRAMLMRTVKTLKDRDGKRRVRILQRDEGVFVITVERWWEEIWEGRLIWQGWGPLHRNVSFFATVEIAEREARREYSWIAD